MGRKTRVLIIDDSALMRQVLATLLARGRGLEVVGVAADPYIAERKIATLQPDVLTLDVEMPRMDGLTFLERLMRDRPMPVVMVSSLTESGCEATLRALELGAVDFVTKPQVDLREHMDEVAEELIAKVHAAASARVRHSEPRAAREGGSRPAPPAMIRTTDRVIAVGASTGGTEALREFLSMLPADAPGVVVVQHMPEMFTRSFAERCDQLCTIRVKEAEDGERVLVGHALIAPGNYHMTLRRNGSQYAVRVFSAPAVNRHRPSVDVLFDSVAAQAGRNAVGVIMTGMGADGALGLSSMRRAGARTMAQDEASSVVFGMPREAIALGAAEVVLPLGCLAPTALEMAA